jgi:uncharacterized membrane protein
MATVQKTTSKQYFQTQTIIHLALIMGQLLFAGVTLYLRPAQAVDTNPELRQMFVYVVPVLAAVGIFASFQIFRLMLNKARQHASLSKKISAYGSAMIVRYAVLEAPSLFGIIAFYLTGEYFFLIISGLIIALFLMVRPSKEKLIQDMELSPTEEATVNDPDAVIMERTY